MTEPDIEPMKPEAKIATLAAPPRYWPTSASARSLKNRPPPVNCRIAPNRMKPITSVPKAFIGMPKDASDEIMKKGITSRNGLWKPLSGSGTWLAKVG